MTPPARKIARRAASIWPRSPLPYDLYTDEDAAHRVIYVEASRGCPFTCEFCLSSLDVPVRQFPLSAGKLLAAPRKIDRTRGEVHFQICRIDSDLNAATSRAILQFFLERQRPGLFAHFEMIPDRLPESLREIIARFPPGALQFEVGVQTFDDAVAKNISRRQDLARLENNFRFLRGQTGVHVHADLIAGLPGETVESFAVGFDRLGGFLGPQEIQVGILKRLRGTPIVRHDAGWNMIYNAHPPYELLSNKLVDFPAMQRLGRFVCYCTSMANSGTSVETTPLLWADGRPFASFARFSEWLHTRLGKRHGIALASLAEQLFIFLTQEMGRPAGEITQTLWRDWQRGGRRDPPAFLTPYLQGTTQPRGATAAKSVLKRQSRHLAASD